MSRFDNQCFYCKRIYRGEGFNGHCTENCHDIKKHNESLPAKGVFSTYKLKKPKAPSPDIKQVWSKKSYEAIREEKIQKANSRWITRTPEDLEKKEAEGRRRRRQMNVDYMNTFFHESQKKEFKKFKACRG